jgi:hypothetical protein
MTHLHDDTDYHRVRLHLTREVRAMIPEVVERTSATIQTRVPTYAGPPTGRRHRLIALATSAAIEHFLDAVERPGLPTRSVDELFRRMGHGEATDGHDLTAMRAAFRIVTMEAWNLLRDEAIAQDWSAGALGWLGDALLAFTEHLAEQIRHGYEGALRALEQDPRRARARLIERLLDGAPLADVHPLSITAAWSLPSTFVLVALTPVDDAELPDLTVLADRYLLRTDGATAVLVATLEDRSALIAQLRGGEDHYRIATSWAVEREAIPDAWRWTRRALELVDRGVIPALPVIDCSEHRAQLWLHSEPGIRQRLCQELLRPLLAETPNSREILSETLLAWLESRDSAPAIAAKLGVHPQTVRYRWKRINELFGEELREPEFVTQATMLLKASVPLWKAGDQSDFERFRGEDVR